MNAWEPERPKASEWNKIRAIVLDRDDYKCLSCGHRALKQMHVHHVEDSEDNDPNNLYTLCPACHAIMHIGLNLQLGKIEIWKASLSQVDIVRATRDGIRNGKSLVEINASFDLKRGRRAPSSADWANSLLKEMGPEPRAELPKPLCAVFVDFKQWQVEA